MSEFSINQKENVMSCCGQCGGTNHEEKEQEKTEQEQQATEE